MIVSVLVLPHLKNVALNRIALVLFLQPFSRFSFCDISKTQIAAQPEAARSVCLNLDLNDKLLKHHKGVHYTRVCLHTATGSYISQNVYTVCMFVK